MSLHELRRSEILKGKEIEEETLLQVNVMGDEDTGRKSSEVASHVRQGKSERSNVSIMSRKRQTEIQAEIKKKELETEILRKEQEILELKLSLKLTQIEDNESQASSKSVREYLNNQEPDVQKWIDGRHPWDTKVNQDRSYSPKPQVNPFINAPETSTMHSHSKFQDMSSPQISKILIRQSYRKICLCLVKM